MAAELTQPLTHIHPQQQQPILHHSSTASKAPRNLSSYTAAAVEIVTPYSPRTTTTTKIKSRNRLSQIDTHQLIPHDSDLTTAAPKTLLRRRKIRKLSPHPSSTDTDETINPTTARTTKRKKSTRSGPKPTPPRIPARLLSSDREFYDALYRIRKSDPLFPDFAKSFPRPKFEELHSPFLTLTRSILYQDLSIIKDTSIYARLAAVCGGKNGIVPETVLTLSPQQLLQIGISEEKSSYLHDLAKMYRDGTLSDLAILNMDDESLLATLSTVKGIGSVEMYMIFSLHRPDVLPIQDLGIRKGYQIYCMSDELPRRSSKRLCEEWRPYRSVGAWYMWILADGEGTPLTEVAAAVAASAVYRQEEAEQKEEQWPCGVIPCQFFGFRSVCTWLWDFL